MLTRRAIEDGATTIVAVGGDGTWSKVASEILTCGADCRLGLIAAGTGNDFAKSVGAPAADMVASARLAVDGPDARVDVGRIDGTWFLNAVGFGFDVAVLEEAERVRWLHGPLLYAYAALRELLRYRGSTIAIGSGTTTGAAAKRLLLVVANGRWLGGAFQIAPAASCFDGMLDAVTIPDASPIRRLRLLASAMRGAHVALPGVEVRQSGSFVVQLDRPAAYEADGERHAARSNTLEITVARAALRVVGAAG